MNPDVPLKTRLEIERLRLAAEALLRVFGDLGKIMRSGITTKDIENISMVSLKRHGLDGAFLGYEGYPSMVCTSVNNVAAHGLPSSTLLNPGDVFTVDIGADLSGWKADCAWTFSLPPVSKEQRRLVRAAWKGCLAGARAARAGRRMGDVGAAIQSEVQRHGCSVVREFTGHGIGQAIHEEPAVLHSGDAGTGVPIVPGMVLNIEPVVTLGDGSVSKLSDGWSYVTGDGALSAQFELTVAVRSDRTDILTLNRYPEWQNSVYPPFC